MFTLFRQREQINHLAFALSGLTLASGSSTGQITIWDLVDRKPMSLLHPPGGELTFVRDDATLVIHSIRQEELLLLDIATGQTRSLFQYDNDTIPYWSAVGEDGETVVAAFVTQTATDALIDVRQVEVSTDREIRLAQFAIKARVAHLALRTGNPLLLAVQELPLRIVLLSPGRLPDEVDVPRNAKVDSLAFAPDGSTLALRNSSHIRLWNVDDKRMNAEIIGPPTFHAVVFSPDGRTLGIGTSDGVVRFYDVATGQQRAAFDWQIGPIHALAFAPDGMRAAAGSKKGTIVVWDVDG